MRVIQNLQPLNKQHERIAERKQRVMHVKHKRLEQKAAEFTAVREQNSWLRLLLKQNQTKQGSFHSVPPACWSLVFLTLSEGLRPLVAKA